MRNANPIASNRHDQIGCGETIGLCVNAGNNRPSLACREPLWRLVYDPRWCSMPKPLHQITRTNLKKRHTFPIDLNIDPAVSYIEHY